MATGITTTKDIPTGKKIERTPEQKERDKQIIENYSVQIDQFKLEILRLEKAIEMDLPDREYQAQIFDIKEKIEQFKNLKKAIEDRSKWIK